MLSIFARLPILHRALIAFFSAIIFIALFLLPDANSLRDSENRLEVGKLYPLTINAEALAIGTDIAPTCRSQMGKIHGSFRRKYRRPI